MRIQVSSEEVACTLCSYICHLFHRFFFTGGKLDGAADTFVRTVRLAHTRVCTRMHVRTSCVQIQFGIELHGRMITDINNSVIMTSTVAEYANKVRRREIKGIEPARWRGKRKKRRRCRPVHPPVCWLRNTRK